MGKGIGVIVRNPRDMDVVGTRAEEVGEGEEEWQEIMEEEEGMKE